MEIIEVLKERDWRLFHQVADRVYRADENYISPLKSEVRAVFHKKKNKAYNHGNAACFVLLNDQQPIGRIAAFVDHERNKTNDFPVGGIGFFECINDVRAANLLFAKAEEYLAQWKIKAIDGPINFGERDRFWGLLVEGEFPPLYQENYHPKYYQQFFEGQGYQPYEQILTFHAQMANVPIERFAKIAEKVRKRYGMQTQSMNKGSNIPRFAKDFAEVYNKAFQINPYFKPLTGNQIARMFRTMKSIADLRMVFITYTPEKPVAFAAFIPDINPFLRKMKGRLTWYKIPGLIWQIRRSKKHLLKGIAFGIDPEYQRRGAIAALIDYIYNDHTRGRYSDFYLATIRGHNSVMVNSISNLGVKVERVHLAYRKMLDKSLPLEPFDFLDLETK
jgi:GNAT superfamily N-acetyltransferase